MVPPTTANVVAIRDFLKRVVGSIAIEAPCLLCSSPALDYLNPLLARDADSASPH
jgi:hypothetical protein